MKQLLTTVAVLMLAFALWTPNTQAQTEEPTDAVVDGCQPGHMAMPCELASMPMPLIAQAGDGRGEGKGYGGKHGDRFPFGREDMDRRRKHLEQLRMLKLLELLDLREDQEAEFLIAYRRFTDDMKELEDSKREIVDQLSDAVSEEPVDDGKINGLLDDLTTIEQSRLERLKAHIGDLRGLLEPVQLAKLAVFQERFEAQMLDRLKEFRERRSGGSGGGPGGQMRP